VRGKQLSTLIRRARKAERERGAQARATGVDRAAPLGRERGGGGALRETAIDSGTHLSGAKGARARSLAGPS
jgi:hypothetical protein